MTTTRGTAPVLFISLRKKRLAAAVFRRFCTMVQNRRNTAAARRFFRRLMKRTGAVPRVVVTDRLRSYGAARREVMRCVEHRQSKSGSRSPASPASPPRPEHRPGSQAHPAPTRRQTATHPTT